MGETAATSSPRPCAVRRTVAPRQCILGSGGRVVRATGTPARSARSSVRASATTKDPRPGPTRHPAPSRSDGASQGWEVSSAADPAFKDAKAPIGAKAFSPGPVYLKDRGDRAREPASSPRRTVKELEEAIETQADEYQGAWRSGRLQVMMPRTVGLQVRSPSPGPIRCTEPSRSDDACQGLWCVASPAETLQRNPSRPPA